LYNTSGGMPHGRLSIATGAVKKAHIISAAKATNLKPSSSVAYRNVIQENQQLRSTNEILTRKIEMHDQMFRVMISMICYNVAINGKNMFYYIILINMLSSRRCFLLRWAESYRNGSNKVEPKLIPRSEYISHL
jgi:hypothetical protein